MSSYQKKLQKPAIVMTRSDHERLTRLADSIAHSNEQAAEELYAELDRARIVPDDRIGADVVRMGSTLRFTTTTGEDRRVTLSFPDKADIAEGRISILSPIGTALIGLKAGQSIEWRTRDDRVSRLTVEEVEPFVAAGEEARHD
jgi:regulator of nucleoside diphosphate kinase